MLSLRADPWIPDFGMGFQARLDETPARADPFVESGDWSVPIVSRGVEPGTVWFVDGVRRVELRLIAGDERGGHAPGLFGSFAVGAVRCDGRATFAEHSLGRSVVVGGGLRPDSVEVLVGGSILEYKPATEPGGDPDAPLFGLQKALMAQEAALASRIAAGKDELVLVDGRLGFLDATRSPVVGVVKRFVRAYLDPDEDALLPRLSPGERTPLFGLVYEGQPLERYAWYTRLVRSRPEWHDHAGLVRCEVRVAMGLDGARSLADRVSTFLPRFAGRPFDPRFPQNLAPVAGLERFLQHRLGHRGLIRRALIARLAEEAV
ncbi:MAG TPA: hypothetical protein VNA32_02635 [Actinomycetota bacterium]|nr:hypothetical protein [Actinomycetota bacterium]